MQRFLEKIQIPEDRNKCWNWTAGKRNSGKYGQAKYGSMRFNGKVVAAHRFSFEYFNDEIPANMIVMHTCDNTLCVNPSHLKLGTIKDNVEDKLKKGRDHNQRKTHCPKGHEYAGDNLYLHPDGSRKCRECMRNASKIYEMTRVRRRKEVCGE